MNIYLIRHTSVDVPKGLCYGQSDDVPLRPSMEKIQSRLQQKKELLRDRETLLKTKEPCKSCEYFSYCRGGCPAAAIQRYGTIMMPDHATMPNKKIKEAFVNESVEKFAKLA